MATKGARLMSVTSNGERTTAIRHLERGRPSFEVQVAIPPARAENWYSGFPNPRTQAHREFRSSHWSTVLRLGFQSRFAGRETIAVSIQEFLKLLRSRWITIVVTTLITILAAVTYTPLQTPLYEASTRLFVATTSNTSASDLYQSSRFSQERVVSYAELVKGETVAQRTIDRLDLDMDAEKLTERVTAKSKAGTVLIDVSVLDESPVRARDIANALSDEFVMMATELETPPGGTRPDARVIIEQRATIPEEPMVPRKGRNLALAIILGGMLGIGVAALRDLLDNTVKSQEVLEGITGAGTVGYIPFDKKFASVPSLSFDSDHSSTAEAFRKLRTNFTVP